MPSPPPWTQQQVDILNALRREGVPASEIAVRLGRTRAAVLLFCAQNKDRVPPLSKASTSRTRQIGASKRSHAWKSDTHDSLLIHKRNAGESTAQIAAAMGFDPETIMQHTRALQREGRLIYDPPPEKTSPYSSEEDRTVQRFYATCTAREIAQKLERSETSVQQRVDHLIKAGRLAKKR